MSPAVVAGADVPLLLQLANSALDRSAWSEARSLLMLARGRGPTTRYGWSSELLCLLEMGDLAGHRKLLAELWQSLPAGDAADPREVLGLAWASRLLPGTTDATPAMLVAVRRAGERLPERRAPWLRPEATEAALLVRLGRDAEAVTRYESLAANPLRKLMAGDYALLALSLHRLGRTAEAREAFARSEPPKNLSREGFSQSQHEMRRLRAEVGAIVVAP